MKTALTIAGSDSSGGAGIQADIKTMISNGVYAMSAITALTAQNTTGVNGIMEVTPEFLREQLDNIFTDIYPDAVKIGMESSSGLITKIADKLKEYDAKNIVVDPVMVATSGGELAKDDLSQNLLKYLLPKAILTTPNVSEAEKLTGIKIADEEKAEIACEKLGKICNNIITGGHLNGTNITCIDGKISTFKQELLKTDNVHGSGCNFSAAIVSYLSQKNDLKTSILKASEYTYESIKNGKYGTLIAKL